MSEELDDKKPAKTTAKKAKKKTGKKAKKKKKKKKKEKKRISKKAKAEAEAKVKVIADALHAIIKEAAPELNPTTKWGNDWYAGAELVIGVALQPDHVNLIVYNGDHINDPEGLTTGVGNNRTVRVRSVEDIRKAPLIEIIRSSAKADAAKGPRSVDYLKTVE